MIEVPLNKLKKSPRNARKAPHSSATVEARAASIEQHTHHAAGSACAACHTPSFRTGDASDAVLRERPVDLYSDLLVHDMGPALADGFVQQGANGNEFRTMTLTNLSERSHFLHDGRATDLTSAITAHGGQGAASATAFSSLSASDRDALIAFLGCL